MDLKGRRIILGITGSIAAYKSVVLLRSLIKRGADVQVLMTQSATSFVQPLTLSVLSNHPVHHNIMDESAWNNHVELGLWADLLLIAPCTAHTMGKLAHGMASDILSAVYLSARCPTWIAPAMDLDMWKHPSTLDNLSILKRHGVQIVEPGHGFLASGLEGEGRLAEPEDIADQVADFFTSNQALQGKRVLINAGPTQERIDPVRYITNHSSGKMGIALAESAARQGADVHLILGPTHHRPDDSSIQLVHVVSAEEMYQATVSRSDKADIIILTAAVADYKPSISYDQKVKKKDENWNIALDRTKDIAAELGKRKKPHQCLVGFALETENLEENAKKKLSKKNLDLIVINSPSASAGFKHDTNKVSIMNRDTKITHYELKAKSTVADDIITAIINLDNE